MRARGLRELRGVHRHEVMRDEISHLLEPEARELREHLALVGNAGTENVVERGDAIRRDDEQLIANLVDIAHFAATMERQAGQGGFEQGSASGDHGSLAKGGSLPDLRISATRVLRVSEVAAAQEVSAVRVLRAFALNPGYAERSRRG